MPVQPAEENAVIASLLVWAVVLIFATGGLVWALLAMRRALKNSKDVLGQNEEILRLSRRGVEIQEEALKQQDEVIRLLRELCNRGIDPGHYKSTQS